MRQAHSHAVEASPSPAQVFESVRSMSMQLRKGIRLLWVDDSRVLLSLYQAVFESLGFEVLAISSPKEALHYLSSDAADVAILDFDMPDMDGGLLASLIKEKCPMLPVILYSGSAGIPYGAQDCVDAICAKAAPREELLTTIERLSRKPTKAQTALSLRCFTPSSIME